MDKCLSACDSMPDCVAAVFSGNNCWLFNDTAGASSATSGTALYDRTNANCGTPNCSIAPSLSFPPRQM